MFYILLCFLNGKVIQPPHVVFFFLGGGGVKKTYPLDSIGLETDIMY